jgi:hypothetical protein
VERKSTWSRLTLPRHQVVRRASRALLICLSSVVLGGVVPGQEDDPSEIFLKAYLSAQQGEKLEHENRFKSALAKFRFAGSLIEELRKSHSDWQPAIVEYRGRKIGEGILRVQERMSRQSELSAASSPLPEVVPSLPESEAWSEPGPEVVAPRGSDTHSQQSSDAAIEEATKKLRRTVEQLQAALEKSRGDLETARKENEAVNARLQETTSKFENAQKEVEQSKEAQIADLHNQLSVAEAARATAEKQRDEANLNLAEADQQIAVVEQQRDEALAQLKAGSETKQQGRTFLAENGDLKLKLTNAQRDEPGSANSTNAEELVEVTQQVRQLQKQLADSEKQNQYLVARIAELDVQLDETGVQLQNAKLAGKNNEDTDRLMRENELLRNIVVRERQEEARRDEARKLMLAELDKLKIKSDALNTEIEFLAQPVTKLSSEELSLLRQPAVSVSDQNRGVLTASFIFAKKSEGDSGEGEAATNNFSALKADLRDDPQSVAHAAKEGFSGASTERLKPTSGNPDQGSE